MRRVLQIIWRPVLLSAWLATIGLSASAQSPEVLKVEPPSWWIGSSMNPVRLLIHGRNLGGARVRAAGAGIRVIGIPRINERGSYLFVDVAIAPNTRPGERRLFISNGAGKSEARFEILPAVRVQPLRVRGRHRARSP